MPASAAARQTSDNEVSLTQIWLILVRRRLWVLAGLVVSLGVGIAYVALKAPVFEARAKVQIGQTGGAGPFEPAEVLAARLMDRYGENVADGVKRPKPFLSRASAQKGAAPVVELAAEGDRPDEPAALLTKVFDEVARSHAEIFARNVQAMTEQLQSIDARRLALQQQFKDATAILDSLRARDPVQASLVMMERGRVLMLLSELDEQKPKLVQTLSAPKTQPTALLGEVSAPSRPAAPRTVYAMALALVTGLLGGILLALLAEFVAYARESAA